MWNCIYHPKEILDRRWLPAALRPPIYLTGLNFLAGLLFLVLGIKGYWDNENRVIAVGSLVGLFAVSLLIATIIGPKMQLARTSSTSRSGEPTPCIRARFSTPWRTLLAGTILGAGMMGLVSWVSGESKPTDKNPIGDKFWPSQFGAEDQRGAANRLTPEKAVKAAQLKQGRTFQLGRLWKRANPGCSGLRQGK